MTALNAARCQELLAIRERATPGDLTTSQLIDTDKVCECPFCQGQGEVDGETYTNYDDKAVGVQFFGIGNEFEANEELFHASYDLADQLAAALELLKDCNTLIGLIDYDPRDKEMNALRDKLAEAGVK